MTTGVSERPGTIAFWAQRPKTIWPLRSMVAIALVSLLVACGSSDEEPSAPTPSASESASATAIEEPEATEAPLTILTSEQAETALLPAEGLHPLFTAVPSDTSENETSTDDLGCISAIDDPGGEPVVSAARDYEGGNAFANMQVDSYETSGELASNFDAVKEALATCGTETIDGIDVELSYAPEFTDNLIDGVDDQIFFDMYGAIPVNGGQADFLAYFVMLRIENNAAMIMLADVVFGSPPQDPLDPVSTAQEAADRLRSVMDGQEPTAAPAAGPGTYEFDYMGAVGTIEVPTASSHPAVAELEEYREAVGAEPVTYLVAEVDNTNGADSINMYQIVVIDEDGMQAEAQGVDWIIGDWMNLVGTETNEQIDLYNRGVDLSNAQPTSLLPGARGTMVLATDVPVESVSRVYVYPAGGFDRVEATKADANASS